MSSPCLTQLHARPRMYVSCNASDPACAAAEVLALRKRLYAVRRDLGALACQHLGIGLTGAHEAAPAAALLVSLLL